MPQKPISLAYITAGAAGMYCGSCMHDNTLARALAAAGIDVQLIPTYTPIRTDEENVSLDRVFFGGINVFLQQKSPLFRKLPRALDRFLDQPWLIRWAASRAASVEAKQLGELTVSMLRGEAGFQAKEIRRLCDWLKSDVRPDLIVMSNVLIAGCAPALRRELGCPVLVTLQGDDVFLEDLPAPYREDALGEIERLAEHIDGFIANSRFYADHMAEYLRIDRDKIHVTPLGIETADFASLLGGERRADAARPPTVGYLARLAPEKGLHVLVDAFIELRRRPGMEQAQLRIAGWLGERLREFADGQFQKLKEAGLEDAWHNHGVVDRAGKLAFLSQIDLLSVPTVYHEPKGLFVLEALAAGVPVVQPEHGAFPELLAATGGGRLVPPNSPAALADAWHALLTDHPTRLELGRAGQQAVHDRFHPEAMAAAALELYSKHLAPFDK